MLPDETAAAAQTRAAALQQENDRLRRDNERFVRIIDSGDWGRGRVDELVQAGQVLKQERDQLRTLMGALRDDYESVERAKVAQHEELAALKERMKRKGAANNKMLVKARTHFLSHSPCLTIAQRAVARARLWQAEGDVHDQRARRAVRRSTRSCAR